MLALGTDAADSCYRKGTVSNVRISKFRSYILQEYLLLKVNVCILSKRCYIILFQYVKARCVNIVTVIS